MFALCEHGTAGMLGRALEWLKELVRGGREGASSVPTDIAGTPGRGAADGTDTLPQGSDTADSGTDERASLRVRPERPRLPALETASGPDADVPREAAERVDALVARTMRELDGRGLAVRLVRRPGGIALRDSRGAVAFVSPQRATFPKLRGINGDFLQAGEHWERLRARLPRTPPERLPHPRRRAPRAARRIAARH
jgi:hypothetical protein